MDVRMHNGLPGSHSHIHAHVVPVWVQIAIQLCICLPNKVKGSLSLSCGKVKKIGDVAEGDNQQVSLADGKPVVAGVAVRVLKDDV
jgi:hypothetical protein